MALRVAAAVPADRAMVAAIFARLTGSRGLCRAPPAPPRPGAGILTIGVLAPRAASG
jgi:hypothetical protein